MGAEGKTVKEEIRKLINRIGKTMKNRKIGLLWLFCLLFKKPCCVLILGWGEMGECKGMQLRDLLLQFQHLLLIVIQTYYHYMKQFQLLCCYYFNKTHTAYTRVQEKG